MGATQEEIAKIKAIEKESRSFECPHCHVRLQFLLRVNVVGIREGDAPEEYAANARPYQDVPKKDLRTPEEQAAIAAAKDAGVLQAFAQTVSECPMPMPKDIEGYFLNFLRCATRVKTPQFAIRLCLEPGDEASELELWSWNAVAVVIADGGFKCFLPQTLVTGKSIRRLDSDNGKPSMKHTTLETWIKTRNGYVVGRGLMFGEMKRKAAGSFDTMHL